MFMDTVHIMRTIKTSPRRVRLAVVMLCAMLGTQPAVWAQAAKSVAPVVPAGAAPATTPSAATPRAGANRLRTIDSIVAVVNNDVITRQELQDRIAVVERRMTAQGTTPPPRAILEKQLLERMIVDRAQLQMAKDTGIRVDDVMLDRAVTRIAEQNKMSLQDFRNQLEREDISLAHFREEIREEIIMQRLREREVDNKIQITESEIDNYLGSDRNASRTQQEFDIAQILIGVPENASPEQIAQRRQRADEVIKQLNAGADFAKMAATYSDASDALKGGELGWRNQDRLPQIFVDAVAPLKQGEVSAAIKSANGFHILKLVGKRNASIMSGSSKVANNAIQQTHARHILIKVNQVVSSADAMHKMTDIKQRLDNKAATFAELAKLYSNDLSASKGGDLGWIYPGDTVPEFERAMDGLQPGQISAPVETQFGYHLIQVLERKTEDVSKERQRLVARQVIRERKVEEATQDWLRQLRDRAYVEYRNDDK
jgi:peptidyl-prolyl cis-trans isomerase SurA